MRTFLLGAAVSLFLAAMPAGTVVAQDSGHPLTVKNNGTHVVDSIYISPPSESTWGDDWLGANTIAAGSQITFTITTGCLQDIKVVWTDGHTNQESSFDTCKYDLALNY